MPERNKTRHHGKIFVFFIFVLVSTCILAGRLGYLMIIKGEYYSEIARELHERERYIKAARGRILDRNGVVIADNRAVCTISVIHNQIENPEEVIKQIEEMKTGCLLKFACEAGAILGDAEKNKYQALLIYSRKIGIAFQIVDDVLDVEGDEVKMGKTLGKDVLQNKLTFVSLYGLEKAKEMAQELIAEAKAALAPFGNEADDLRDLADFIICRAN